MEKPIPCFVAGDNGYVWDASGAMQLRKKHRVMGCLVGSVAQFKNQNEVNCLPLQLSADEVTLALRQGWVELLPETAAPVCASAVAAAAAKMAVAAAAAASREAAAAAPGGSPQWRPAPADPEWETAYQLYYSQYEPRVGFTGRFLPVLGSKRRLSSGHSQQQQQPPIIVSGDARQGGTDGQPAAAATAFHDRSEPAWRAAVTEGVVYTLPLTAAAAAAARAGVAPSLSDTAATREDTAAAILSGAVAGVTFEPAVAAPPAWWTRSVDAAKAAATEETDAATGLSIAGVPGTAYDGGLGVVGWTYPRTPLERLRFAVFCDLHRQGFMLTGGIKFGSDMLAYPGDPALYHAQFTVRPISAEEVLHPFTLKAAARGSHAARKHMLLAFCEEQHLEPGREGSATQPPRIRYMSFAPESGFGSKA